MRILITGSSGFLGCHLIETILSETDHEIVAMTSRPEKLAIFSDKFPGRIIIVSNERREASVFRNVDILVNCAFPRNEDGGKMADGLCFITDVLKNAADNGVGAVINISSQSVYSQQRTEPATEETPLCLETKYAVGKYAAELLTNTICNDIPHTNLRMASLIGAGFDQRVTNRLIDQALSGNNLHIITGNQLYGFIDVRDAAKGILELCKSDTHEWDEVYNFGCNLSYTLDDIALLICDIYSKETSQHIDYTTSPSDKMINSCMDCSKFISLTQWKPYFQLKDTLIWIWKNKKNLLNDIYKGAV